MANTQPFNRDHKTIIEARLLALSFPEVLVVDSIGHLPRSRRELNGKSRKDGGFRVPIESKTRRRAEKKYRMTAKNQLRRLLEIGDGVVQDLAKCQPHDWRW